MPSKRKKNKRRMRRVQAQRRVLEEQHVAGTGTGKGTPGVAAVAAPPVKVKEVAKCPKLVPIQTQVVNIPVVALLAPVEVPEPKPPAVEAEVVAAEVEVAAPVEAEEATLEVEAPIETPDVVDGPVEAPEEVPVVEVEVPAEAPVGPPTEETAAVQEGEESVIPKTELVMEALSIPEAPVPAPEEFEVQVEDSVATTTEIQVQVEDSVAITTESAQTHDEPSVKTEVEAEIVGEVQAEVEAVVEPEPGPVVEARAASVVETEVEIEEVVINAEDSPVVEAEVIPMVDAGAIPEEVEVEEAPVVTEDEPVTTEAPTVETEIISETQSEPMEAPVEEAPVAEVTPSKPLVEAPVDPVIDTVADDFVVTGSVPMSEPAIEEQVPAVLNDALEALSGSLNDAPRVPEPAPVTADEVIDAKEEIEAEMEIEAKKDTIDENTALDVLSGDVSAPQPVISELQCHTQLASATVELANMDIPAEAALNGHMATEVAIEG